MWRAIASDLKESVILIVNVVSLLREVAHYNVLSPIFQKASNVNCDVKVDDELSYSHMAADNVVNGNEQSQNVSKPEQSVNVTLKYRD